MFARCVEEDSDRVAYFASSKATRSIVQRLLLKALDRPGRGRNDPALQEQMWRDFMACKRPNDIEEDKKGEGRALGERVRLAVCGL